MSVFNPLGFPGRIRRVFQGGFGRPPRRRRGGRIFVDTSGGPVRHMRKAYHGVDKRFMKNYLQLTESKFIDTAISETPVIGTSDIVLLNGVATGDIDNSRDGEALMVTSIQYKLQVQSDVDMTQDIHVWIILVIKKDVRGQTIAVDKLYVSDSGQALRLVDNSKNFHILSRRMVTLKAPEVALHQDLMIAEYYKKFKKPIKIKYKTTASTVTALDRNAIFVIFMTDGVATKLPSISGNIRVTFKDI